MGTKTLIFTLFVSKSALLYVCSSYYSIFWISETSAKNFRNFCADHVVGNFRQIHVIRLNNLFCTKKTLSNFLGKHLWCCFFNAHTSINAKTTCPSESALRVLVGTVFRPWEGSKALFLKLRGKFRLRSDQSRWARQMVAFHIGAWRYFRDILEIFQRYFRDILEIF